MAPKQNTNLCTKHQLQKTNNNCQYQGQFQARLGGSFSIVHINLTTSWRTRSLIIAQTQPLYDMNFHEIAVTATFETVANNILAPGE